MEQKRPSSSSQVDLVHLEAYLEAERERLLSGLGIDDDVDNKNYFYPISFFREVTYLSGIEQKQNDPEWIDHVAARLDYYVPDMFDALEYRGDDFLKVDLYDQWGSFLSKQGASNERQVELVCGIGNEQILNARKRFQMQPAFDMLDDSLHLLKDLSGLTKAQQARVAGFVTGNALETIQGYVTRVPNGLDRASLDRTTLRPGGAVRPFHSLSATGIKAYDMTVKLAGQYAPPEEAFAFAEKAFEVMSPIFEVAERGGARLTEEGEYRELVRRDMDPLAQCLMASMQVMKDHAPSYEAFCGSVNEYVPPVLAQMVKQDEGVLCRSLYDRTIHMLGYDSDAARGFARAYGTRTTLGLSRKLPQDAALMMDHLHAMFVANADDSLVLTDPTEDENAPVVAARLNLIHPHSENDYVVFFQGNFRDMARDSRSKSIQFSNVLHVGDKDAQWSVVHYKKQLLARNDLLDHPVVKHYGHALHSFPTGFLLYG